MIPPRGDSQPVKTLDAKAQDLARTVAGGDAIASARMLLMGALDTWSECAWDKEAGGFVECLDMAGVPDIQATRRVRVHAR